MFDKLDQKVKKYDELSQKLSSGDIDFSSQEYRDLSREHKYLEKTVQLYDEYKELGNQIKEAKEMIDSSSEDEELLEYAKNELEEAEGRFSAVEEELRFSLFPKDPNSDKNVIMEIRAGTGGDEAALFVSDLYRMYNRYAEKNSWTIELLDYNETEQGGYKEIIYSVSGDEVYDHLKFETGGHRVQRIPVTESGGRIHTSAVTVAILPEVEEAEVDINPNDLRIDTYRSSGPGGQSVNTTDSAIRITHLPTGIVVQCQDEKSQHKNKAKAMRVLRARIQEKMDQEQQQEMAQERKQQIGSGDRSERIRTYNFPQNRVTDHRINFSVYNKMDGFMNGEIDEMVNELIKFERQQILEQEMNV